MIKLTPDNLSAVDARAKKLKKAYSIPVSRSHVANKAIAVGITHLNKEKA